MPLGTKVGLSPGDSVLDGDPAPFTERRRSPQFSAHVYCGETAGCIKIPLGTKVGLSPGDSMLDGDPAPLRTKSVEPTPEFSAHFYCGQTAGCIKMPLGMEVGLGLRNNVFDVDPATQKKGHTHPHPILGPCLLWPNGWMDEDAATEVDLGPGHIVLDGVPAPAKWAQQPPIFGPATLRIR